MRELLCITCLCATLMGNHIRARHIQIYNGFLAEGEKATTTTAVQKDTAISMKQGDHSSSSSSSTVG